MLKSPTVSSKDRVRVAVLVPATAPSTLEMDRPVISVTSSKRLSPDPAKVAPLSLTFRVALFRLPSYRFEGDDVIPAPISKTLIPKIKRSRSVPAVF